MHVFKTQGIVLRMGKISERELWYKIFFQEYGVLMVQKQKKVREKPIDIGYHISCEILTHEQKKSHTIWNIAVLRYFESKDRPYQEIELFLKNIALLQKNIPDGVPHQELFLTLKEILSLGETLRYQKMLLLSLKIQALLGNLPENHTDITSQKILRFIHQSSSKDILRLAEISEEVKKNLEQML